MLDHVGIFVTDLAKSQAFYEKALKPLGIRLLAGDGAHYAGFGTGEHGFFWLGPSDKPPGRVHVAFASEDRDTVHAFYEAALAAGGTDNGGPGAQARLPPELLRRFRAGPGRPQHRGRLPQGDVRRALRA
jgi:catechol 2,3-dioxygenase-like lactoylglutathione lyase family enzyme